MSAASQPGSAGAAQDGSDLHSLPALFWDEIPENAEEHPDYAALLAIDDECTPEERAHNFKEQGNRKLQLAQGEHKVLLREAVDLYSKGLALKVQDVPLNATLYSNRSHVESLLGNWRKSYTDALSSLKLQPSIKAYFRAARAALNLAELSKAQVLCKTGLGLDPQCKELKALVKEAQQGLAKAQQAEHRKQEVEQARMAPYVKLAGAITQAGYKMARPQVQVGERLPWLDEEGQLHWPVVFLYPQAMQQDVIEDVEGQHSLADHLDVMFGEDAPPLEWDDQREYTRDRIEVYYLTHAGKPLNQVQLVAALQGRWPPLLKDEGPQRYGDKAAKWCKVPEECSFHEILSRPDFVIPGVPLFFVVAKGTAYRDEFLREEFRW